MPLAIESRVQRRHPLPALWLMTDERQGETLWPALNAMPRHSGVVVRHYSLAPDKRRELIANVRKIVRRRKLVMVVAGTAQSAIRAKADGFHQRSAKIAPYGMLRTVAVHNRRELVSAHRVNADLVFISPAFITRSHPKSGAT